jgi:CO dehydrogenase maturation factor
MKVAFMGKGGSGKTTITASFIHYVQDKYSDILAIDSDINKHLQHALAIQGNPIHLGNFYDDVAEYTEGERWRKKGFNTVPKIGSIPVSSESKFIYIDSADQFMKKFALTKNNIHLLTVGAYEEEDHGDACYHSKLSALEVAMHRIVEREDQLVVSDVTAGLDPISTSLILAYDIVFLIIEPTLKGVSLYKDVESIFGMEFKRKVRIIINKVRGEQDKTFIEGHIPNEQIVAWLPHSQEVKSFEQDNVDGLSLFVRKESENFGKMYQCILATKKDWNTYKDSVDQLFRARCQKWYTSYYGIKPEGFIDSQFSYQSITNA